MHAGVANPPLILTPAYLLTTKNAGAVRYARSSLTPAFIVDVGIGRSVYATVHCRRPSVSRRRGTNTEQFAGRNDAIKFPAKN